MNHQVEGVTLLGGEPFDQAKGSAALAKKAWANGLGVICFTGYDITEAAAKPGGAELLAHVDLLVDGPFLADQPEPTRALVGSTNQRFIHLTDRYTNYAPESVRNRVEIRVNNLGEISASGFLTTQGVGELARSLESRRVQTGRPH